MRSVYTNCYYLMLVTTSNNIIHHEVHAALLSRSTVKSVWRERKFFYFPKSSDWQALSRGRLYCTRVFSMMWKQGAIREAVIRSRHQFLCVRVIALSYETHESTLFKGTCWRYRGYCLYLHCLYRWQCELRVTLVDTSCPSVRWSLLTTRSGGGGGGLRVRWGYPAYLRVY